MLTRYTKERLSRHKLIDVSENKIPQEPQVMKDLKMLKEDDLELDYNYSGSDITDPFEEEDQNEGKTDIYKEFRKAKKKFNQMEIDLKLMNSFSEDFKKTMDEVRSEMKISSNLGYEDMAEVDKTLKSVLFSPKVPTKLKKEIEKILLDEEHLNIGPEYEINMPPAEEPPPSKEYDAMSSVWRMLDSNKKLLITPEGYDAQRQKESHWMDTPGAPWEEIDESKTKCEEWIKTQLL